MSCFKRDFNSNIIPGQSGVDTIIHFTVIYLYSRTCASICLSVYLGENWFVICDFNSL